eukprot:m.386159 g.386159  ORF g.386159 m.386159 type:complete len:291 (-) comp20052_c0_seq5:36-908(-)
MLPHMEYAIQFTTETETLSCCLEEDSPPLTVDVKPNQRTQFRLCRRSGCPVWNRTRTRQCLCGYPAKLRYALETHLQRNVATLEERRTAANTEATELGGKYDIQPNSIPVLTVPVEHDGRKPRPVTSWQQLALSDFDTPVAKAMTKSVAMASKRYGCWAIEVVMHDDSKSSIVARVLRTPKAPYEGSTVSDQGCMSSKFVLGDGDGEAAVSSVAHLIARDIAQNLGLCKKQGPQGRDHGGSGSAHAAAPTAGQTETSVAAASQADASNDAGPASASAAAAAALLDVLSDI